MNSNTIKILFLSNLFYIETKALCGFLQQAEFQQHHQYRRTALYRFLQEHPLKLIRGSISLSSYWD